MTTQELKNNIEKVLGNSIRCLLPSYWWKKLFHSVADRIDEVEVDVNNTLTKSFKEFEGKHPDVADRTFYIIYYGEEQAKQQEKNKVLFDKVRAELTFKPQVQPCYIAAPVIGMYLQFLSCVNAQILTDTGNELIFPNIYIVGYKKWMDVVIHEDGNTELRDTRYGSATSITVDSQLSDTSTNPVQNKVVKKYIDDAVANIEGGGGGSNIVVDTEMSSTSTNPVQNKVVYSELQKKQDTISDLADIRSGAALGKTALQQADIANLATKEEVIANEEVHASALVDLDARIRDIVARLNNAGL